MLHIGKQQRLKIMREKPQGYYLSDGEDEVLMPRKYITPEMDEGDEVEVLVYCDSEGREIATTETPALLVGEYAYLRVTDVKDVGAFCDWGVTKELFIPFSNQLKKMEKGQSYVVHMYLDDLSERLVGSTKLRNHLLKSDEDIHMGQKVKCLPYAMTPIGIKVVLDQKYDGMIYSSELQGRKVNLGEPILGYVRPLRPDGKIDVSLDPVGRAHVDEHSEVVIQKLTAAGGKLPYSDKSSPEDIRKVFGMSKKLFKKTIGGLYKQKTILIKEGGIELTPPS